MKSDEPLPIVRELGVANFAASIAGLTALLVPSFVLPAAISAAIYYGLAGVRHVAEKDRSLNENVALTSDLFIAVVFIVFIAGHLTLRAPA